jgi:hypothetical protein
MASGWHHTSRDDGQDSEGPHRQAPSRSLRPNGGCRVSVRARPTDRFQDSSPKSVSRNRRVRPGSAPTRTLTPTTTEMVDPISAHPILAAGSGRIGARSLPTRSERQGSGESGSSSVSRSQTCRAESALPEAAPDDQAGAGRAGTHPVTAKAKPRVKQWLNPRPGGYRCRSRWQGLRERSDHRRTRVRRRDSAGSASWSACFGVRSWCRPRPR